MLNMGPGMVLVVPRYSPPRTHPHPTPRVHPSPALLVAMSGYTAARALYGRVNMVVGLISVGQLSLDVHFSGFQGITVVYNLVRIGRINNH